MVAPGFSPALDEFIEEAVRVQSTRPLVIMTVERSEPVVYWAGFDISSRRESMANKGVLMMRLWFDMQGKQTHVIPIPRGLIIGWRLDSDGEWYANLLQQGYQNGNRRVSNGLGPTIGPPRRGR